MTPKEFEQWSFELIRSIENYIVEAQDHDPREVPEEMENTCIRLEMLAKRN